MQTFKQAKEAAEEEDGWLDRIEEAPIYTPTAQEWEDPLDYIRSEPRAAALGGGQLGQLRRKAARRL